MPPRPSSLLSWYRSEEADDERLGLRRSSVTVLDDTGSRQGGLRLGSRGPNYYLRPGKSPPPGPLMALLPALAAAFILSTLYAYATVYVPFAGYVTIVFIGGFAALVGHAASLACRFAKLRNDVLVRVIVGLTAAFALYSAWAMWAF